MPPPPPPLSRRRFLLTTTAVAGALAPAAQAAAATPGPDSTPPPAPSQAGTAGGYVPPSAVATAPTCIPTTLQAGVMEATGTLGSVTATVRVKVLKDVVALRYHLTNIGDTQNTYTVSYNDLVTTFDSRAVTRTVDPGAKGHGVLYGSLEHEFQFYVDLPDGTTLSLGPLNEPPACLLTTRKPRSPIYQPPRRHHRG